MRSNYKPAKFSKRYVVGFFFREEPSYIDALVIAPVGLGRLAAR